MDFEGKMRKAILNIEKFGLAYGEARSLSNYLVEMRKVVLASEMSKFDNKSVAERDMLARDTQVYRNHLQAIKEAQGEEYRLKAMYEKSYATYESLRSLCSYENSKVRGGIIHEG